MSETRTFQVGDTVSVSPDADDVYFEPGTIGTVVADSPSDTCEQYRVERRVNVQDDWGLTQYVRPEDLTLITSDN